MDSVYRGSVTGGRGSHLIAFPRVIALVAMLLMVAPLAMPVSAGEQTKWIVRSTPSQTAEAAALAEALGGSITLELPIIDGFVALLDETSATKLAHSSSVVAVTPDFAIQTSGGSWSSEEGSTSSPGDLAHISQVVGADTLRARGVDGTGIDVAIIDSGIVPIAGLSKAGKIVNGADYSFDSAFPNLAHLDFYGHGTHLASIIAADDRDGKTRGQSEVPYQGIAPGARLVNVKVANAIGLADVSQVIAGIGWVVEHRRDNGMNVRVLALAFGTDSTQDYRIDPLAYAVEQAWKSGIVVVAAAGNDGNAKPLRNPAKDPFVIAVGSMETQGTVKPSDDTVSTFTNCGTGRTVDVLAPGRSVLGLRVPGSYIDDSYPSAVVDGRFFKGTGTSQATAVVAGTVALILDQRPELKPDQVKRLLTVSSDTISGAPSGCSTAEVVDLRRLAWGQAKNATQTYAASTGTGSLEASRGSHHVAYDGVVLEGEQDWLGGSWSGGSWSGGSWSGGSWSGVSWSGGSWSGVSWSGVSWSGVSWSGFWSAKSWT